ncbi:unnamed protein product [Sphacelaria rigidula]
MPRLVIRRRYISGVVRGPCRVGCTSFRFRSPLVCTGVERIFAMSQLQVYVLQFRVLFVSVREMCFFRRFSTSSYSWVGSSLDYNKQEGGMKVSMLQVYTRVSSTHS